MSLIIVMDMYTLGSRRLSGALAGKGRGKLGAQNIKGGPLAASTAASECARRA